MARDGDVTLTGTVEWLYLKTASEVALRHIQGIRRVINQIVVIPQAAQIRR